MILRLAALSLLCLPFLGVWLGTRRTTIPEYRQHHRVLPHNTVTGDDPLAILNDILNQVGPPPGWTPPLADQVPAAVEHVSFPCSGCNGESSRLRFNQTSIVQVPTGYALVGVCRSERIHSDGLIRPCGRALISAVVDASAAAEFVNQGAKAEHGRLVVFRAELGDADLIDKLTRP
jgi:hypothetical protein